MLLSVLVAHGVVGCRVRHHHVRLRCHGLLLGVLRMLGVRRGGRLGRHRLVWRLMGIVHGLGGHMLRWGLSVDATVLVMLRRRRYRSRRV